jgi:hypothetical protein
MEEYKFESFFDEKNINKKYYKKFKKFHKDNNTSNGNEYYLIKFVDSMDKVKVEPIKSATFERNLARCVEKLRKSNNPEQIVKKWYDDFNLKFNENL